MSHYEQPPTSKRLTIILSFIQWCLFLVLLVLAGFVAKVLLPQRFERLSYGVFGTFAAITSVLIIVKIEKSSLEAYGLIWQKNSIVNFLKGLFIGTLIIGAIILLLVVFSKITFINKNKYFTASDALWYVTIIPLALMEEIAFRSYSFIKINSVFNLRHTQFIIAIAFALYHFVQGWPWQVSLLGPGIWAFIFGLGAYYSKGIALPTGIHVALNIIQPLIGMKPGNYTSLWLMENNNTSSAFISSDDIGLIAQLMILIGAIFITERCMRKA